MAIVVAALANLARFGIAFELARRLGSVSPPPAALVRSLWIPLWWIRRWGLAPRLSVRLTGKEPIPCCCAIRVTPQWVTAVRLGSSAGGVRSLKPVPHDRLLRLGWRMAAFQDWTCR
jgi:hypothetical protein